MTNFSLCNFFAFGQTQYTIEFTCINAKKKSKKFKEKKNKNFFFYFVNKNYFY